MNTCIECSADLDYDLFLGVCDECWDRLSDEYLTGIVPIEKAKKDTEDVEKLISLSKRHSGT